MTLQLNPGRAGFFMNDTTLNDNKPAVTGTLVLKEDAKAGDKVFVALWGGNENPEFLTGTARVSPATT